MQSRNSLFRSVKRNRGVYLFVLPGLVFYLVFRYYPLYYLQIAFRDFRITRPLEKCAFAGWTYFREVFTSVSFAGALRNTLIINALKLLFCFPAPILVALLLNELRSLRFKRCVQTILYLPHFVSWVVISSIIMNFTTLYGGLFNNILKALGHEPVLFLGRKDMFRTILVISDLWKESGYGAIIYLAALTSIDPQLYDAAAIDGAGRLQRMWHVSLAGIKDVVVMMLILRVGAMMGGNFDQVQTLLNDQVMSVGDTLATFVYRVGIANNRHSFATAAGLFDSAVGALLLILSDRFAKRIGERGLI